MAYFDLRFPLGWLFVIVGGLLLIASIHVAPVSSDGNSVDLNVNLVWGIVLVSFGIICAGTAHNYARKRRKLSEAK